MKSVAFEISLTLFIFPLVLVYYDSDLEIVFDLWRARNIGTQCSKWI